MTRVDLNLIDFSYKKLLKNTFLLFDAFNLIIKIRNDISNQREVSILDGCGPNP